MLQNKENNVFKDALGVKGLGFKHHGNHPCNHGSHYGNHHGNYHDNHSSDRPYPDFSSTSYGRVMWGQSSAEPCRTVPNKVRQQSTATTYGKNERPSSDVV